MAEQAEPTIGVLLRVADSLPAVVDAVRREGALGPVAHAGPAPGSSANG
jgi:hypothetical protein